MGVNQSLCLDQNDQPTHKWCTYEDVNQYTNIVQISFFSVVFIFGIIVIGQFRKLLQLRKSKQYGKMFGKLYIQIFALVFIWIFFSLSRALISIIIYESYMSQDFKQNNQEIQTKSVINTGQDPSIGSPIVVLASVYTFAIFITSWIINFLMILIPYKWLKGILLNTNEAFLLSIQNRKTLSIYFMVLNAVKFYCKYFRIVYLILLFIQPFLLFFTKFAQCLFPLINYYYTTIQATLILFFYIFVLWAGIYIRNNRLIQVKKRDRNIIKIEYALLVIILITRIFLNFYYRILKNIPYLPNNHCSDTREENWGSETMYIMHFLPILLVVFIYRPSVTKRMRDRSYISHQQRSSSLRTESGDLSALYKVLIENNDSKISAEQLNNSSTT